MNGPLQNPLSTGCEGESPLFWCSQLPLQILAWLRAPEEAMFMGRLSGWQKPSCPWPGTWLQDWVGGSCVVQGNKEL